MLFDGKLFKDKDNINQRNKDTYRNNIKELADLIREADKNNTSYSDFLLDELFIPKPKKKYQFDQEKHSSCKYKDSHGKTDKKTEKRICRCMKYYNPKSDICQKCSFEQKYSNKGKYIVSDYEVPTKYVIKSVGKIDLLIEGDGKKYAVELKPEGSNKETLVRMIAEILTYMLDIDKDKYKDCKPAICFFKNSVQYKDYIEYQNDENFKFLLTKVDVFYITYDVNGDVAEYIIHNHKNEPICE